VINKSYQNVSAAAWRRRAIRARLSGKSRAGCSAPALVHVRGPSRFLRCVSLAGATTRQNSGRSGFGRASASYLARMSTSPVSPEDIRAAAEVRTQLGPEYNDAVVAAFIAEVDRQVAARVEARLAETDRTRPVPRAGRWTLVKGMAIGICAGALTVAGIGLAASGGSSPSVGPAGRVAPAPAARPGSGPVHARLLPYLLPRVPSSRQPIPVRRSR
jgi:hypothetical protein